MKVKNMLGVCHMSFCVTCHNKSVVGCVCSGQFSVCVKEFQGVRMYEARPLSFVFYSREGLGKECVRVTRWDRCRW